jgi:hypothetical protein
MTFSLKVSLTSFDDRRSTSHFQLEQNHRDVRRVEDLRAMRQVLCPQLWVRLEDIRVSFRQLYLRAVPFANQRVDSERTVSCLEGVRHLLAVFAHDFRLHIDCVDVGDAQVEDDCIAFVDYTLRCGETHLESSNCPHCLHNQTRGSKRFKSESAGEKLLTFSAVAFHPS